MVNKLNHSIQNKIMLFLMLLIKPGHESHKNLFIWGFMSLSTLYRSYHDG